MNPIHVDMYGYEYLLRDSTRLLRSVSSILTCFFVFLLYMTMLSLVGNYSPIIVSLFLAISISILRYYHLISWNMDQCMPVLWCCSPVGVLYVYSAEIFFPFLQIRYPEDIIQNIAVFLLHLLNLLHFISLLIHEKSCNLCTSPYVLIGLFHLYFPDHLGQIGASLCIVLLIIDTIHHYASHHVKEVSFGDNFISSVIVVASMYVFLTGIYSLFSEICGVLIALVFFLNPSRHLIELFIDPESIFGIQVLFIGGQVVLTALVKLGWPEVSIFGAFLRGIITGRILLMYTIYDELKSKKALGKTKLI